MEFGCGDGNQLSLASYARYAGLDVSLSAIRLCKQRFAGEPTKSFLLYDQTCFVDHADVFVADLALSLDVIYHLVEDTVYEAYMSHLFGAGQRYVIVYSTNKVLGGQPRTYGIGALHPGSNRNVRIGSSWMWRPA